MPFVKEKKSRDEWDKKTVDLSWKLYQPHPPKRNARDSMKPWTFDKYLRSEEENAMIGKYQDLYEFNGKTIQELVLEEVGSIGAKEITPEEKEEFQVRFRLPTSHGARVEASHTMGFRIGLNQFKNPKPYDFRGVIKGFFMHLILTNQKLNLYFIANANLWSTRISDFIRN